MSFGQTFRRGRVWAHFSSRGAYRFYFFCFAILLISGVALRLEAVIYGRQITSVVTALSTLRVGETSEADALSRIPRLRPSATGPYGVPHCNGDECFSMFLGNGLPGRILWRTSNSTLSSLLRWWGFRSEGLNVWVTFTSGKVSYFVYDLTVSAPGVPKSVPPPPTDGDLGAVVIGVSSQSSINRSLPNSAIEEHPPYVVTPARAVPSQSIGIVLTPNAPEEIVHGAFNLKLHCLWSFGGCRRWNQLLPAVQPLIRQYSWR
jgi:hypothetical protein